MRVQLLSQDAAYLVGFAKKKLRELRGIRLRCGVLVLSKTLRVGDTTIFIETADWGELIRLSGSSRWPFDIVLSDRVKLYGFSLEKQRGRSLDLPANGEAGFAQLGPLAVAHDPHVLTRAEKTLTRDRQQSSLEFAALLPLLRSGGVATDDGVYLYSEEGLSKIASYSEITPSMAPVSIGNMLGVFGESSETNWNKLDTIRLWAVGPTQADSYPEVWRWYPRLWCPVLANAHMLRQGIYYGSVQGGGLWGPCAEIETQYGAFLDARGGAQIGYCEVLTRCTDCSDEDPSVIEGPHLKAFFFYQLWEPPRGFDYYENQGKINSYHDYYTAAPQQEFRIDYDEVLAGASKIKAMHWWSAPDAMNKLGEPIPQEGILAAGDTGVFVLHKQSGYQQQLLSGTGYKDHSVSEDGRKVAILYSAGVDHILYYDFEEEKTLLDKPAVGGNASLHTLEIIPTFEGAPPFIPPDSVQNLTRPTDRDKVYEIPMLGFSHPWPPGSGSRATGWKVFVETEEDGRLVGVGKTFDDECWTKLKYKMYQDPDGVYNHFASHNLIMAGGPDGRHGTTGTLTSEGIPTVGGWSPAGDAYIVERAPITFGEDIYGCLSVSMNTRSPVKWTGDVAEKPIFGTTCWTPAYPCSTRMKDGISYQVATITLTDQCVSNTLEFWREAVWNTVYTGCADKEDDTNPGPWCFPGGDFEMCDWVYTSPTTRYLVTLWVPLGSSCEAYRVEQELAC